jgi:hypothetical protein
MYIRFLLPYDMIPLNILQGFPFLQFVLLGWSTIVPQGEMNLEMLPLDAPKMVDHDTHLLARNLEIEGPILEPTNIKIRRCSRRQDWRMRFIESTSNLIVERLKDATRRNTKVEEMGETITLKWDLTWSRKAGPGLKSRSERTAMIAERRNKTTRRIREMTGRRQNTRREMHGGPWLVGAGARAASSEGEAKRERGRQLIIIVVCEGTRGVNCSRSILIRVHTWFILVQTSRRIKTLRLVSLCYFSVDNLCCVDS